MCIYYTNYTFAISYLENGYGERMINLALPSEIKYIEPKEFTPNNVMYFCHHAKELKQTIKSKALKFIKADCIRYVGDMGEFKDKYSFVCLPLNTKDHTIYEGVRFQKEPYELDYNSRVYTMAKHDDIWSCNCQAYVTKEKKHEVRNFKDGVCCSHLLALFLAFKMRKFKKGGDGNG